MVEYSPVVFTNVKEILKDKLLTREEQTFRVVGQFNELSLLITWTSSHKDKVPNDEATSLITYVGITQIRSDGFQVITQFPGEFTITSASVNRDLSIIAFVTETVNQENKQKSWQSYVCRCSPQEPVAEFIAVTDSHSDHVRVQFLPEEQPGTNKSSKFNKLLHELSILVLIHLHSIQIHKFEVGKGVPIRLGSCIVLCLEFQWCQWVPWQQCLIFLHPWGALSNSVSSTGRVRQAFPTVDQETVLSCVQFIAPGHFSTVFSIPASTIGIRETLETRCGDEDFYLNKISSPYLNLEVCLWNEGNVCICYQPFHGKSKSISLSNSTFLEPEGDHSEEGDCPLYFVTLLHHGVQYKATKCNDSVQELWPLHFAMTQDHHLLIISEGGPVHVLDTDPSHRIGFQILIPESSWPLSLQGNISVISMPNDGSGSSIFLTCGVNSAAVSLSLNHEELVSLFCSTQVPNNRKSIIHYFATHSHNLTTMKNVLTAMSHDAWSLETKDLLTEYLLGSTFARLKKSGITCHPILYHLPVSEKSHVDCGWLKVENLSPSLDLDSLLSHVTLGSSRSSECGHREGGQNEFWHWLWHHQVALSRRLQTDPDMAGFRMDSLATILEGVLNEDLPVEALINESPTITRNPIGFADLCALCMKNKNAAGLSLPPDVSLVTSDTFLPFPPVKDDLVEREKICSLVWSKLRSYLQKCCPLSSNVIINKICGDYIMAQLHQSNILCSLIFSVFGISVDDSKPKYYFRKALEQSRLQCLHAFLERFFVTCRTWSFPLPVGFNSVLMLMSYSSLNFLIFMQHVQMDAIKLQYESVLHLVQVLDDGPENLKKKLHLIGYLPKDVGEAILRQWNHPIGDTYRARRRARVSLATKDGSPEVHQVSEHDVEQVDGIPVEAEFAVEA